MSDVSVSRTYSRLVDGDKGLFKTKAEHEVSSAIVLAQQTPDNKFVYFKLDSKKQLVDLVDRTLDDANSQHFFEMVPRGSARVFVDLDARDGHFSTDDELAVDETKFAAFVQANPNVVDAQTARMAFLVSEQLRARLESDCGVQREVTVRVAPSTSTSDLTKKRSAHLVVPNVTMTLPALTELMKRVKADLPAKIAECVDMSVYSSNRLMRLLGSCKVDHSTRVKCKGNDEHASEQYLCGDYDDVVEHRAKTVPETDERLVERVLARLPAEVTDGHSYREQLRRHNCLVLSFDSHAAHDCHWCKREHENDNTQMLFVLVDVKRHTCNVYSTCRRVCDSPIEFDPQTTPNHLLLKDVCTNVDDHTPWSERPPPSTSQVDQLANNLSERATIGVKHDDLVKALLADARLGDYTVVKEPIDFRHLAHALREVDDAAQFLDVFFYVRARAVIDNSSPKQVFVAQSSGCQTLEWAGVDYVRFLREHLKPLSKELTALLADQRFGIHTTYVAKSTTNGFVYVDDEQHLTRNLFVPAVQSPEIVEQLMQRYTPEQRATFYERIDVHLTFLCGGDEQAIVFLKFYLHLLLVDAEFRPNAMPIIRGRITGEGKSAFFEFLKTYFGAAYSRTQQLNFGNGYAEKFVGRSVLVVDEFQIKDAKSYNQLKDLVTGGDIQQKRLYQNECRVPMWVKIIATTNESVPIRHMIATDRRMVFIETGTDVPDADYFRLLFAETPHEAFASYFITQVDADAVRAFTFERHTTRATQRAREISVTYDLPLSFVAAQYRSAEAAEDDEGTVESATALSCQRLMFGRWVLKDMVVDAFLAFYNERNGKRCARDTLGLTLESALEGWVVLDVRVQRGRCLWRIGTRERVVAGWNQRTMLNLKTFNL